MSHTILITGVSGHLGSGVLDHLLKTVPADRLIALARDPKKVERYAAKGVTIRQGDYNDPASLDKAFSGVHTLLLIPTADVGPARLGQHRNAVDAAKRAGVQHILYTGVIHHDEPGHGFIVSDHQNTEKLITASGIPHTFIRNGIYLDVLPMLFGNAAEGGVFPYPAAPDGVTFALRADLAEATAKVVATPALQGKPVELGLPRTHTYADVATALSRVVGKPIVHADVPLSAYRDAMVQHGVPAPMADVYRDMARSMTEGVIRQPVDTLKDLLGREPIGVEAFLRSTLQPVDA